MALRSPGWWELVPPESYSWLPSAERSSGRATSQPNSWLLGGDGKEKAARQLIFFFLFRQPRFYPPPQPPPPYVLPSVHFFPGPITLQLWGERDLESAERESALGADQKAATEHPCSPPAPGPWDPQNWGHVSSPSCRPHMVECLGFVVISTR